MPTLLFIRAFVMETKMTEFNGVAIAMREEDGYWDATAMCSTSGKLFSDYWRLESTQAFLKEISTRTGFPVTVNNEGLIMGYPIIKTGLVQSKPGRYGGTWVHPLVAMNLGQWCDPVFAAFVATLVLGWFMGHPLPSPLEIRSQKALEREHLKLQQVIERGDRRIRAEQLKLERIQAAKDLAALRIQLKSMGMPVSCKLPVVDDDANLKHARDVLEAIALTPNPSAITPVKDVWKAIEQHYVSKGTLVICQRSRTWAEGWHIKGANQVPYWVKMAYPAVMPVSIGNNRKGIKGVSLS